MNKVYYLIYFCVNEIVEIEQFKKERERDEKYEKESKSFLKKIGNKTVTELRKFDA